MKFLTLVLAGAALFAQESQRHKQRGQSGPPDESQSWTRGRLGSQGPLPGKPVTLDGVLVDASCEDRSALNLARPAEQQAAHAQGSEAAPAVHDHSAHQTDRSCAVTGGTRGFALLMKEGRLLNLDEGGNTMVIQGLHANPEGRAMLNGTGGGIKPRATIRGKVHGDRFIVEQIVKL